MIPLSRGIVLPWLSGTLGVCVHALGNGLGIEETLERGKEVASPPGDKGRGAGMAEQEGRSRQRRERRNHYNQWITTHCH